MAWTTISNAAVAVGAIPSSSTVTALRDNPVAVADASSGAPVVFAGWHPYDKVSVGDGKDGLIYDFAVDGVVASVITPDFVDGYEYRIVGVNTSSSNSSVQLIFDLYKETSAVYVAAFTSTQTTGFWSFDWDILMPRISASSHLGRIVIQQNTVLDAASVTASYNATVQKALRARLIFNLGSFDAGKIWMFRRREYASSP
jgi:hypothetical protein